MDDIDPTDETIAEGADLGSEIAELVPLHSTPLAPRFETLPQPRIGDREIGIAVGYRPNLRPERRGIEVTCQLIGPRMGAVMRKPGVQEPHPSSSAHWPPRPR